MRDHDVRDSQESRHEAAEDAGLARMAGDEVGLKGAERLEELHRRQGVCDEVGIAAEPSQSVGRHINRGEQIMEVAVATDEYSHGVARAMEAGGDLQYVKLSPADRVRAGDDEGDPARRIHAGITLWHGDRHVGRL